MKVRKLLFLVTIPLIFFFSVAQGQEKANDDSAEELVREKSELKGLQEKIENERDRLKEAREKEKKVVSELNRIEKDLADKKQSLRKYRAQLKEKQSEIRDLTNKIEGLQRTAAQQEDRLARYGVDLYKLSRADLVKTVFSAQSFSDLLRRHEYLTRIIDHNAAVIDRYGENIRKVEAERTRLQKSEARLIELAEKEGSTRAQVLRRKREKRTLLARVKTEKDLYLSSIEELEEASRQLQALIEKLEQESDITGGMQPTQFSAYKSKFIFPVDGDIITPFGKYEDEAFATITFNNGIEISAPEGSPIKAVFEGVVIYADWFKGYGKLLIIDHGEGYYTLSGHASKLVKQVGDQVTEGEIIGYVGDTGSLTGPNLYFEIRHHGKPVDPMEWLAARE